MRAGPLTTWQVSILISVFVKNVWFCEKRIQPNNATTIHNHKKYASHSLNHTKVICGEKMLVNNPHIYHNLG